VWQKNDEVKQNKDSVIHVAVAAAGKITVTAGAQKKRPRSARKMKDDPKSAESSGKVWYPSYEHMKCNT
jgi:hypothetical protein